MDKNDLFTEDLQTNARLRGQYDDLAASVQKCVFCDLRDKYIIKEKNGLVLTVNIFPYINGHLMIIPKRHIENFSEVTKEELNTYQDLTNDAIFLLKDKLGIESYWLLLRQGLKSGKSVKHLHWQIMPFIEEIVTWHYRPITIAPIDLAAKLREH